MAMLMVGKYEKYVIRKPRIDKSLPYHEARENHVFPILIDNLLVNGCEFWATYNFYSKITEDDAKKIAEFEVEAKLHKHKYDCPEVYLLLGDENALVLEVTLGEEREKYRISPPAAVYIPGGLPHGVRLVKAEPERTATTIYLLHTRGRKYEDTFVT